MSRENITRIKAVNNALEELAKDVVFVGGATAFLYAQRPSEETRPTDDVDIIIELINYNSFAALDEKLRKKGFENDKDSGIICRYKVQGIIVDIMPTLNDVIGFSNRWYPEAFKQKMEVVIDQEFQVFIFSAPYFIATKLEAFKSRGNNDGRLSSDFEDIVYVLNNRNTIWDEFVACTGEIKEYLYAEFNSLINTLYLDEWISAHLSYTEQDRVNSIMNKLKGFVEEKR